MDWDKENQENQIITTPTEYIVSNLTGSVKKNYVPTPKLSERKRALFPKNQIDHSKTPVITEEAASDSSFDSFLDGLEACDEKCPPTASLLKTSSLLSRIEDGSSALYFLSETSNDVDIKGFVGHLAIEDTSLDYAPSKNTPKTPYETLNTDLELPRIRKSLPTNFKLDDKYVEHSLKRKLDDTPDMEPQLKQIKLDKPKVRTSLFSVEEDFIKKEPQPEDGLSPKSFYRPSLSPTKKPSVVVPDEALDSKDNIKKFKIKPTFLCNRTKPVGSRLRKRTSLGEINAGVRTGIRKRKRKAKLSRSLSNHELFKAEAIKFLKEKSVWNVKIESKTELPSERVVEMDKLFEEMKNRQPEEIQPPLKKPKLEPNSQKHEDDGIKLFQATFPLATERTDDPKPRKFFKSKQPKTENMTINILKNVNLNVANGKVTIEHKPFRHLVKPVEFDPIEDTSFSEISHTVEEVLKKLEPETKTMEVTAHFNAVNENSILLHEPPAEVEMVETKPAPLNKPLVSMLNPDDLMSPTSLMCNMTSGLALSSPKKLTKAMNLTDKLSSCPAKTEKLFPIFTKYRAAVASTSDIVNKRCATKSKKVVKNMDPNQYQIDAGQKKWGITQCPECEFVYSQNEPEDLHDHYLFHNRIPYRQFSGWKNERVVGYFPGNDARAIEIRPSDNKAWWNKVICVLKHVVDLELGYPEVGKINETSSKVYFYVNKKEILGVLAAEPVSSAYRIVPDSTMDSCSNVETPIKCGISRLWVSKPHRRKHIATQLIDAFRRSFFPGHILSLEDFAYAAPTGADGKIFIETYSKTKAYLVYI